MRFHNKKLEVTNLSTGDNKFFPPPSGTGLSQVSDKTINFAIFEQKKSKIVCTHNRQSKL